MELKTLGNDVIASIKSCLTINTLTQCVTELVLNSLDAKSTSIAVRINMLNHQIQVVDNGEGISRQNLILLGKCYMTNKCHSLSDFHKASRYYGFRGEALASICNIATKVTITSRLKDTKTTYKRIINEKSSKTVQTDPRPSCGTTIIVEGLFERLPVRQKALREDLEFDNVKRALEVLIIIHPEVSYTLRNDITSVLIVNSHKHFTVINALQFLYPELEQNKMKLLKVSKEKFTIDALFYEDICHNKKVQYFYVNKRPVAHLELQKLICSLLLKGSNKISKLKKSELSRNRHPVYIINIKCPNSELDLLLTPSKYQVHFKNIQIVTKCLEKTVSNFFGSNKMSIKEVSKDYDDDNNFKMSVCGVSRIAGAVRGYAYRWDNEVKSQEKQKLEDDYLIEEDTRNVVSSQQDGPKTKITVGIEDEIKKKKPKIDKKPLPLKLNIRNINDKDKIVRKKLKRNNRNKKSGPKTSAPRNDLAMKTIRFLTQNQKDDNDEDDDFHKRVCSTNKTDKVCISSPENSVRGKEMIMDKFLKCSQMFRNKNSDLDENSGNADKYFLNLAKTKENKDTNNTSFESLNKSNRNENSEENYIHLDDGEAKNISGSGILNEIFAQNQEILNFKRPNEGPKEEGNDNLGKKQKFCTQAFKQPERAKSTKIIGTSISHNAYKTKGIQTSFVTPKNADFKSITNEKKTSKGIQTTILEDMNSPCHFKLPQEKETYVVNQNRDIPYAVILPKSKDDYKQFHEVIRQNIDDNLSSQTNPNRIAFQQNMRPIEMNYLPEMHDINRDILLKSENRFLPFSSNNPHFQFRRPKIEDHILKESNYGYSIPHINEIPRIFPEKEDNNRYYFCHKDMTVKLFDSHEHMSHDENINNFQPITEHAKINHYNTDNLLEGFVERQYNFAPGPTGDNICQRNDENHFEKVAEISLENVDLSPIRKDNFYVFGTVKQNSFDRHENNVRNKLSLKKVHRSKEDHEEPSVGNLRKSSMYRNFYSNEEFSNLRDKNIEMTNMTPHLTFADLSSIRMIPTERKNWDPSKTKDTDTSRFFANTSNNTSHHFGQLKDTFDLVKNKPHHSDLTSIKMYPTERKNEPKTEDSMYSNNISHYFTQVKDPFGLTKKKTHQSKNLGKNKKIEMNISLMQISSKIKADSNLAGNFRMESETPFLKFCPLFKSTQYNEDKLDNFQDVIRTQMSPLRMSQNNVFIQKHDSQNKPLFTMSNTDTPKVKNPANITFPYVELDGDLNNQSIADITFVINDDDHRYKSNKQENIEILSLKSNESDSTGIIDMTIYFENSKKTNNNIYQKTLPFNVDNVSQANKLLHSQEKRNTIEKSRNQEKIEESNQPNRSSFNNPMEDGTDRQQTNEIQKEWVKILDQFGKIFYFNKRTGMTTFYSPKREEHFDMALRSEFVPKGLSPILIESKKVDKTLSPRQKEKLIEAIMKSYENELLTIKWENYVQCEDPERFFSELYREKSRRFGSSIPAAKSSSKNLNTISFDKTLFKEISVIGQLDMKFIITLTKSTRHLILFDQHAVHERIRLEDLQTEYNHSFHKVKNIITIFLQHNDVTLLVNHRAFLQKLGLVFEEITNAIKISSIPLCLWKKIWKENGENLNYLSQVVESLINQILEMIKSKSALVHAPPLIEDIVNMEACRGAIKFGQALSKEVCNDLIQKLQRCNLPFQCAHGRPTLIPFFKLQSYRKSSRFFSRVKLEKLSLVKK